MGGSKVKYESPQIPKDDSFEKYLAYQQQKETAAEARAATEKAEAKAAARLSALAKLADLGLTAEEIAAL